MNIATKTSAVITRIISIQRPVQLMTIFLPEKHTENLPRNVNVRGSSYFFITLYFFIFITPKMACLRKTRFSYIDFSQAAGGGAKPCVQITVGIDKCFQTRRTRLYAVYDRWQKASAPEICL